MCNKFQSSQRIIEHENLYDDKTPEQIFIEKRAELFLKEAKKHPEKFRYGIKRFNFRFKYIKNNLRR